MNFRTDPFPRAALLEPQWSIVYDYKVADFLQVFFGFVLPIVLANINSTYSVKTHHAVDKPNDDLYPTIITNQKIKILRFAIHLLFPHKPAGQSYPS